jgi:hypothetical protein
MAKAILQESPSWMAKTVLQGRIPQCNKKLQWDPPAELDLM